MSIRLTTMVDLCISAYTTVSWKGHHKAVVQLLLDQNNNGKQTRNGYMMPLCIASHDGHALGCCGAAHACWTKAPISNQANDTATKGSMPLTNAGSTSSQNRYEAACGAALVGPNSNVKPG
jgi:hypothetical protein